MLIQNFQLSELGLKMRAAEEFMAAEAQRLSKVLYLCSLPGDPQVYVLDEQAAQDPQFTMGLVLAVAYDDGRVVTSRVVGRRSVRSSERSSTSDCDTDSSETLPNVTRDLSASDAEAASLH